MYEIRIKRSVQKAIAKFPSKDRQRIRQAINNLSKNPRPEGCVKLSGRDGYRLRVGTYCVLYDIYDNEAVVIVIKASQRGKAYR